MKRFHVHVAVPALEPAIRFYSAMFGAGPAVQKPDYAKWMLDDPQLNFAISQRGGASGLDHLGIQLESDQALEELHGRLRGVVARTEVEEGVSCCYARSNKAWSEDPAGLSWEAFHTLGSADDAEHGAAPPAAAGAPACCAPRPAQEVAVCCGQAAVSSAAPARGLERPAACCD